MKHYLIGGAIGLAIALLLTVGLLLLLSAAYNLGYKDGQQRFTKSASSCWTY